MQVSLIASDDKRKKGEPEMKRQHSVTTSHPKRTIFCAYNEQIESLLTALHEKQRAGDKHVQREIDRYLVCCNRQAFQHLLLSRHLVPHYDNLPDIYKYAIGILDSSMDSDAALQQVLLLLRQCIPLRRRTKRAQREVQWKTDSWFAMQTLIRCIQGTLLGLYPTSTQTVAFEIRMVIFQFIRTILVLDFKYLQLAMQKLQYVIKICVMEHLCSAISDYYPGIAHTLNKSGQKVEHFCYSVSTICDIFRAEINSMFCVFEKQWKHSDIYSDKEKLRGLIWIQMLPSLERLAHSYFERCTRAYRGIIIGNSLSVKSIDIVKKALASDPQMFHTMKYLFDEVFVSCNQHIFELIHSEKLRQSHCIDFAWHLTRVVNVKSLPLCIVKYQLEALSKRYTGDLFCIQRCRTLHICFMCAIKRGSASGMKLRHDCQNGNLTCMYCETSLTVFNIDMLGKLVTIGNDILLLSCCCGQLIRYSGSGSEFKTKCGIQCAHKQRYFRQRESMSGSKASNQHKAFGAPSKKIKHLMSAASITNSVLEIEASVAECDGSMVDSCSRHSDLNSEEKMGFRDKMDANSSLYASTRDPDTHLVQCQNICEVCGQKGCYQNMFLLDVPTRSMRSCVLCMKHSVPKSISQYIYDVESLRHYHAINAISAASSAVVSTSKKRKMLHSKSKSATAPFHQDSTLPNSKKKSKLKDHPKKIKKGKYLIRKQEI